MQGQRTYHKIADHIRIRIKSGVLKTGDRLPSFQQLHRQFGAATSTVDKAYAALEVDGLIERRKRSGVFVMYTRPQTTTQRHLALLGKFDLETMTSHYWTRFLMGIRSAAIEQGADIAYHHFDENIDWSGHEGLLSFCSPEHLPVDCPSGYPIVTVLYPDTLNSSVCLHDYEAGLIAARHLISLGHRRIGYSGWIRSPYTQLRLAGYRLGLLEANISPDDRFVFPLKFPGGALFDQSKTHLAFRNMEAWLEEGFRRLDCTAIIAQNDWYAMGTIECLQSRGYRVPDDISVVGFDNEPDCELFYASDYIGQA